MKVLVTGGAGFLGSHLSEYLLLKGNKVVCLDNFFTGKIRNIENLKLDPNFAVLSRDITTEEMLADTVASHKPLQIKEHFDRIYNFACPASPIHYQFDPIETIKVNTLGIINVLEFAKLNGARVFQASTSEIYGDPLEHPQKESYYGNVNTLSLRACYDEGKRIAETLFSSYHKKYHLPTRIARIFNTYGPKMDVNDGRVVSNFVVQALKNNPITIYGNGKQTRSFCFVSDLIDGIYRLMESDYQSPVNLGNPNEISVLGLAKKIVKLTNSKSKIVFKPLPEADPKRRNPDISLAKKKLNWEPKLDLETGLRNTIEYFKEII